MKIKAAWITSGFSANENDYRGAAAMHNLARELSLHPGIELTIFSFYYPAKKPEYNFYEAKIFSFAENNNVSKFTKIKIWRGCMKKFAEVHSRQKFDLIHVMWAGEPGYIASKLSKKFNLPLAVNVCGGELAKIKEIGYGSRLKFWQKKFVDISFRQAERIVCGSDYALNKIKGYYPEPIARKSDKIPFGTDEKLFQPITDRNHIRGSVIINIASAVPVKSHSTLFKAIKLLTGKYPDILLKVYGRDDRSELEKTVNEMGLNKNVKIMGFINYEDVPRALNEADIYVLSSLYESQNMSLIEAAFCGLPLVSTKVGAAEEVTEHIASPGDFQGLASKISFVLENLDTEKRKSLDKLETLKQKFSLPNSASNFVNLYKSLI